MSDITSKTIQEIAADHVEAHIGSNTRRRIFAGYQNYNKDFSNRITPTFCQWIGGSFITRKLNPDDIDVINLIPGNCCETLTQFLFLKPFLKKFGSKDRYNVDGHYIALFPEDDPLRKFTDEAVNYWLWKFGQGRDGEDRIIVEASFPEAFEADHETS